MQEQTQHYESQVASRGFNYHVVVFFRDYYRFINLLFFVLMILPLGRVCRAVDQILGTRTLEGLIHFCELF